MAGKGDNILKSTVERVTRLKEERQGINADIRDVFAEAKIHGLDVKVVKELIRLLEMDPQDLKERNALLEDYSAAMGLDLL